MHSTRSIVIFVLIMTTVVSLLLAFLSSAWAERSKDNALLYAKKATLGAVSQHLEMDYASINNEQVSDIFKNQVEQKVLRMDGTALTKEEVEELGYTGGQAENVDILKEMKKPEAERVLPLFIYKKKSGDKFYILSAAGKGLWDVIWGCVALESDLRTLAGVSFDHAAETPGLGAEIKDNKTWVKQFTGTKIYDEQGNYTSVYVRKGGAKDPDYEVDGISGATITANGVSEMLKRGLKYYEPYLKSI